MKESSHPAIASAGAARSSLRLPRAPLGAALGEARRSLGVAVPLCVLYLLVSPPAGDLAAATYRSDLFGRVGFSAWDTGWYAAHGHWLPGYSLLSPALGWLLGVRMLLALSALAACVLFALIAHRPLEGPPADRHTPALEGAPARAAAVVFALGACAGMLSGRVPYYLGLAIGLGAVLALMHRRLALALALALLSSLASPIAGSFLVLAGVALALSDARAVSPPVATQKTRGGRGGGRGVALALTALLPIATLAIAYPEGGYEPFAPSAFWPALGGVLLFALALPQGPLSAGAWRTLRVGAGLYALGLIAAYFVRTPMGGNAARLGPLLVPPLVVGVLWGRPAVTDMGWRDVATRRSLRRRDTQGKTGMPWRGAPRALALLAPALLYWQLATPIRDSVRIAGDPSVNASYYGPLRTELAQLTQGRRTIVEVPLTHAHWEAAYLPGRDGIALARGWERQLDTRYASIFYRRSLTSGQYRAWLTQNRVAYVALPDAPLDGAGRLEGRLVARGLPYLRAVWSSPHWRLYRVIG